MVLSEDNTIQEDQKSKGAKVFEESITTIISSEDGHSMTRKRFHENWISLFSRIFPLRN